MATPQHAVYIVRDGYEYRPGCRCGWRSKETHNVSIAALLAAMEQHNSCNLGQKKLTVTL